MDFPDFLFSNLELSFFTADEWSICIGHIVRHYFCTQHFDEHRKRKGPLSCFMLKAEAIAHLYFTIVYNGSKIIQKISESESFVNSLTKLQKRSKITFIY